MADVKKVIDHLICSVCLKLYENPKYLSCYHSFCNKCLEIMKPQSVIACPICRKETTLPTGGIKELDDNFFIESLVDDLLKSAMDGNKDMKCQMCQKESPVIAYCIDCALFLCYSCDKRQHDKPTDNHKIVPLTEPRIKEDENLVVKPVSMKCSIHDAEPLFCCETCDQLACVHCRVHHDGHQCFPIEAIINKYKDKLKEATVLIEKLSGDLFKASNTIERMSKNMQQEGDEVIKNIDEHYNHLILKLEEQKNQMKEQVHDSVSKRVEMVRKKVEQAQAEVKSMKELSDTLNGNCDRELLAAKNLVIDLMQQQQHMTSKCKKIGANITQQVSTKFIRSPTPFLQFGWLCSTGVPAPHKCEVVNLPTYVYKNHATKFNIAVKDDIGHYCYRGDIQVNAQLDNECLQVSDSKNGRYTIFLVASKIGEAVLTINVNGKQINGSPFNIMVNRSYTTMSKPIKIVNNSGILGGPWGISFGTGGMWAVTDYSKSLVYIYNSKDEPVKMIGSPGKNKDQFECPFGIAFDDSNNLYVVDGGNKRIQKFDLEGNFLCQFGGEKLRNARGITVHDSKVYVTDKANRCIAVFNTDGQYCYTIKSQHLRTPCDVTVGVNNQLYVSDSDNRCIHTFTLDGNYICKLGTSETTLGTGWDRLCKPWGLATDTRGNLLVTDADKNQVFVFDKDGICIHCFGSNGREDGKFNTPFGIAISPKGNIYVCDYENKRIQIF